MTEMARKTGAWSVATIIAIAAAFTGGIVGASFQAGAEHQTVQKHTVDIQTMQDKIDKLKDDDSLQRDRIAVVENSLSVIKDLTEQQRSLQGDLNVIQGQLTVLLRQLPVSSLKMEPKGIHTTKRKT